MDTHIRIFVYTPGVYACITKADCVRVYLIVANSPHAANAKRKIDFLQLLKVQLK